MSSDDIDDVYRLGAQFHTHRGKRLSVYLRIDEERLYQEARHGGHQHSVTEWLVYMRDYIEEALHTMSRHADPVASTRAMHNVRKATALGVACMEQHGAPSRWGDK